MAQLPVAVAVPVAAGLVTPQVVTKSAGQVIDGSVGLTFQVYVTVLLVVLLQASVAVTVKVWVLVQPETTTAVWVTLVVTTPQLSVAVTSAATLASLGSVPGLQPRSRPVVGTVR